MSPVVVRFLELVDAIDDTSRPAAALTLVPNAAGAESRRILTPERTPEPQFAAVAA